MNVDVKDCGNYVEFEFEENISNGWAIVGSDRRQYDLDKDQVTLIVEKLSEWLKKQAESKCSSE